ncbi:tRNA(Met) cytidine acetyltransferase [Xenorhabdus nematophila]|uniref:tRNA(Met) cytidine acetyltransferase TmcA n=1 Tax=Xenorhabdus nematophila TaxID=628 RepID=UPI0005420F79|nr:GNAT family N-acetyltransferase [Xenorhabdus nematophila]CEE94884.1 putative acyl-CoA N-acyltransferase with nucleoside triphosphate hydrolase [Xenorhabdus nematophila str. Anatoliense]CEF29318.1 putative acyl-CoA N-acyltransferase with nucleoside triphosphate hydrolase [Xenorhabdus nematophila str. Websteri]AYA39995.1 GNAT family N-acetyltransferase [Xenorhabdus nematophila]MBA0018632.1 tRNA(Met) cytidine acetyltransferase [Xenorhabdus nematophila]MCB4425762.1 GNAT family N-acetyltransfera
MTVQGNEWEVLQAQMQQQGQRRLVVLSGDLQWSEAIVARLKTQFQGDWLTVSSYVPDAVEPTKAVSLLGREFLHGIFDATHGFNAEALAILAGTLKAGSWLVMRVPMWSQWTEQPDEDSLRWNESGGIIPAPHFIRHIQQQILMFPDVLLWRQETPLQLQPLSQAGLWQMPDGNPTVSQQTILNELLQASRGVWVITAPRGRGKSALAGMLVRHWHGKCWLCAPAKITTEVIRHYSGPSEQGPSEQETPFWSVDNLLKYCRSKKDNKENQHNVDWLLIDEAAAIPTPQLAELIRYFPRVLLTSTVQGYEGTGRGFLLKLCAELPECQIRELKIPMRWAENDPLETWLDSALLFDDKKRLDDKFQIDGQLTYINLAKALSFYPIKQSMWLEQPALLGQFYGLLTSAHYRTSPLDLRRLLDGNEMEFLAAISCFPADKPQLVGALWMVNEGGLSPELAHEIWASRRRPRGNLVAQSLAAHAGFPLAATLKSQRVSRIAVQAQYRRRGIAQHLITQHLITRQCQGSHQHSLDFLSVSFGYTDELWSLWRKCGFQLVRMGTHREASSGCYTAMAILPLSEQGHRLAQSAQQQLSRDARELGKMLGFTLPITYDDDQRLNGRDWQELSGFAFAHRPLSASYFALQRLLLVSTLTLPALRKHIQQGIDIEQCACDLSLSGRKALLKRWRDEAAHALASIDEILANQWKSRVISYDPVEANCPHHPIDR